MAGSVSSCSKTALLLDSSLAPKRPAGKLRSHLAQTLPFDYMIKCPAELHRPRNTFSEWPVALSPQTVSDSVQAAPPTASMPVDEEATSQLTDISSQIPNAFLDVIEHKPVSTDIRTFDVHSCVLAKFDMFGAIMNTPMKEHYERAIFIPDYDAPVIDKFIDYVYDEWIDDVSADIAVDLIKLADCYLIPDLKELCGIILSGEAARKPIDMCAFAHTYGVKTLKLECERILPALVSELPDAEVEKLLERTSHEWGGMHTLGTCCQKVLLSRLACDNALRLFKLAYETSSSDLFEGVFQFFRSHWDEMLSSSPLDAKYLMEWNVSRARLLGPSVFTIPGNAANDAKDSREGHWVRMRGRERMPARAVRCGTTDDGTIVYVGRANYENFVIPGYVLENTMHYSYAGQVMEEEDSYEVLVSPLNGAESYAWVRCNQNAIPPTAIYGGIQEHGERLFIGRRRLDDGDMLAGKVHPSHSCLYIGADDREIGFATYEILVKRK